MRQITIHKERLDALRRIEGQIRGIQNMVEEEKYCVDILVQIQAVIGALSSVSDKIFQKHLEGCVVKALQGKSAKEKKAKINEVIEVISKFRRA